MNTIKSNLQFFERAKAQFGDKICVFNSQKGKKGRDSGFRHASTIFGVKKHLHEGAEIVIMCGHYTRFSVSILDLLDDISHDTRLHKQVMIHIDEAHAYVPPHRDKVVKMNNFNITQRIYMYTATFDSLWTDEESVHQTEQLFKHIYIVDCEEMFNMIRSDKYFGVKDCSRQVVPKDYQMKDEIISTEFIEKYGDDKQKLNVRGGNVERWYTPGVFSIGHEVQMLSHTEHTLGMLKNTSIRDGEFSYNFVPGFCRKLTHYALMEMILTIYPTALVVLINGDGTQLFRMEGVDGKECSLICPEGVVGESIPNKNEPSEQIEWCIRRFPDRPTFVTGFHCVQMSVTFINQRIGNFDNVIYSHEHYMDRPDVHYQLCRFLFNYTKWTTEAQEKIKKTMLYVSSLGLVQNCLDYENQVDEIGTKMSGSMASRSEVVGDIKIKEKKVPKELKYAPLEPYAKIIKLKKISVDDAEDEEAGLEKVKRIYSDFMGKELRGKSMPKKNEEGFYECSTTKKEVFSDPPMLKKTIENWSCCSSFALKRSKFKYARVYVAYCDLEDNKEYVWFVRMMEVSDCTEVDRFWDGVEEKKKLKEQKKLKTEFKKNTKTEMVYETAL